MASASSCSCQPWRRFVRYERQTWAHLDEDHTPRRADSILTAHAHRLRMTVVHPSRMLAVIRAASHQCSLVGSEEQHALFQSGAILDPRARNTRVRTTAARVVSLPWGQNDAALHSVGVPGAQLERTRLRRVGDASGADVCSGVPVCLALPLPHSRVVAPFVELKWSGALLGIAAGFADLSPSLCILRHSRSSSALL